MNKLSKARLKQIIKEEVAKTIKLTEATIADVAAEHGVVPPEEEELGEMASIGQVAADRGAAPEVDPRAKALNDWYDENWGFSSDESAGSFVLAKTREAPQGKNGPVYMIYASKAVAERVEWPDHLDTEAWTITWSKRAKNNLPVYAIETDILFP